MRCQELYEKKQGFFRLIEIIILPNPYHSISFDRHIILTGNASGSLGNSWTCSQGNK